MGSFLSSSGWRLQNPSPNLLLLPNHLLIPTSFMADTMVVVLDTMVMVLDTVVMVLDMGMDCGDARRGKLKPNQLLQLNHLLIPTSTMDLDMDLVMVMDTMEDTMVMVLAMAMDATIGENKPKKSHNA